MRLLCIFTYTKAKTIMEKKFTEDDLRKAIALFAYNWQTNIMREQLANEHNKLLREVTVKDFYDMLPSWEHIEYDVKKLNKSVFNS